MIILGHWSLILCYSDRQEDDMRRRKAMRARRRLVLAIALALIVISAGCLCRNSANDRAEFQNKLNHQPTVEIPMRERMGTIMAAKAAGWRLSDLSEDQEYVLMTCIHKRSGKSEGKPWQLFDTAKVPAPPER